MKRSAMRVDAPTFPLTVATFESALRAGHGRALQHVSELGGDGLEALILEACTSCWAYDPQCEAARAPWLATIAQRAGLQQQVVQAIGALAAPAASEGDWDRVQCCGILKELAAAGIPGARPLLYSLFSRVPGSADVIACAEIVALDGVDGLVHVARQLGQWLEEDPAFRVDAWLFEEIEGANGPQLGADALAHVAASDLDVARYLAASREARCASFPDEDRTKRYSQTAAEVVAYVRSDPPERCIWLRLWGTLASAEARAEVFATLLDEEDPGRLARLLRCFGGTGVPGFDEKLLQWIGHADESVRWPAIQAVARLRDDRVREYALRSLVGGDLETGIRLLVANYQDGDMRRCEEGLDDDADSDDRHGRGLALLAFAGAHRTPEAVNCLLYVYEFSPCSNCRNGAVEHLIDLGVAPDWLLHEATFDVDPDTRARAGTATR